MPTSGFGDATHFSTTLDRRSTITLNPIATISHAAPAVRPDSRPTVGRRMGAVVVTSAGTSVPGGVVVTMPGPAVVVVVTTFGAAVDVVVEAGGDVVCGTVVIVGCGSVVVEAGGDVVCGTVVIVGCGSVVVDPPWPLVVVDVACPPLPGGAVVYGGKVPGSLKVMSRG